MPGSDFADWREAKEVMRLPASNFDRPNANDDEALHIETVEQQDR
jgi:hypothetical protein